MNGTQKKKFQTCWILNKNLLYTFRFLIGFPQEIGKNELINAPSTMISVLSNNKALECDKLVITTSQVGGMKFPIVREKQLKTATFLGLLVIGNKTVHNEHAGPNRISRDLLAFNQKLGKI